MTHAYELDVTQVDSKVERRLDVIGRSFAQLAQTVLPLEHLLVLLQLQVRLAHLQRVG